MNPKLLFQLNIHFTTVFELRAAAEEALVFRPNQGELDKSRLAQIARYVAATGQVGRNNNTQIYTLIVRNRASCVLGQAFHYSPVNAFYIFNQQIYFII